MPDPSPQAMLVHDYLKSGRKLTNLAALTSLGIGSLSRRITELRVAGHTILDEWGADHWGRRYKRYFLPDLPLPDLPTSKKAETT